MTISGTFNAKHVRDAVFMSRIFDEIIAKVYNETDTTGLPAEGRKKIFNSYAGVLLSRVWRYGIKDLFVSGFEFYELKVEELSYSKEKIADYVFLLNMATIFDFPTGRPFRLYSEQNSPALKALREFSEHELSAFMYPIRYTDIVIDAAGKLKINRPEVDAAPMSGLTKTDKKN